MGIGQLTSLLTSSSFINAENDSKIHEDSSIENLAESEQEKSQDITLDRFTLSSNFISIKNISSNFNVTNINISEVNQLQEALIKTNLLDASIPNQARLFHLALRETPSVVNKEATHFDLVESTSLYFNKLQLEKAGFHPIKEAEEVSRLVTNIAALRSSSVQN